MNTIARRYIGTQPTRRPGPAMHPEHRPPRWLEAGGLETCTGIVIGGAIGPSVPTMTQDGERIQAALLDPRTAQPRRIGVPTAAALWMAATGAGAAAVWLQINF